jgi:hypothetical protein
MIPVDTNNTYFPLHLLLFSAIPRLADAQVLRLIRRLDKCLGGEPCRVQPIVSIVRSETEGVVVPTSGNIDEPVMVDFEGSVFVRMYPSPVGPSGIIPGQQEGSNVGQQDEPLRIGTCNSTDYCGITLDTDVIAMQHAVPFVNGFASFSVSDSVSLLHFMHS